MCLERRTSQVGGKQAAVRTDGQNSACVLFVFGVNFPWLPGLSAFCLLASRLLVCWPPGRPWRLSPSSWAAFSGPVSTLFLCATNHVRSGSPWWFVLQRGDDPGTALWTGIPLTAELWDIVLYGRILAFLCSSLCRLSYFVRLSRSGAVVMCL